jgi:hypothetical protein
LIILIILGDEYKLLQICYRLFFLLLFLASLKVFYILPVWQFYWANTRVIIVWKINDNVLHSFSCCHLAERLFNDG